VRLALVLLASCGAPSFVTAPTALIEHVSRPTCKRVIRHVVEVRPVLVVTYGREVDPCVDRLVEDDEVGVPECK